MAQLCAKAQADPLPHLWGLETPAVLIHSGHDKNSLLAAHIAMHMYFAAHHLRDLYHRRKARLGQPQMPGTLRAASPACFSSDSPIRQPSTSRA